MAVTRFFKIIGYATLWTVGFFHNDSGGPLTKLLTSDSALEISGYQYYS